VAIDLQLQTSIKCSFYQKKFKWIKNKTLEALFFLKFVKKEKEKESI